MNPARSIAFSEVTLKKVRLEKSFIKITDSLAPCFYLIPSGCISTYAEVRKIAQGGFSFLFLSLVFYQSLRQLLILFSCLIYLKQVFKSCIITIAYHLKPLSVCKNYQSTFLKICTCALCAHLGFFLILPTFAPFPRKVRAYLPFVLRCKTPFLWPLLNFCKQNHHILQILFAGVI